MTYLSNRLNELSQWMLQFTLIALFFASLAISQAQAVELKPVSQAHASVQASSAGGEKASESDDKPDPMDTPDAAWNDHDMGHDNAEMAQKEERIAREVTKEIMKELPKFGDSGFFGKSAFSFALLIPILAILFVLGGPILLAVMLLSMHYKSKRERQQAINANIDKLIAAGRDIPTELLRGDNLTPSNYTELLHKGIKNLFIGLGLLIFLTIFMGIWLGSVGFIVMAVGLSQLIIWKISAPKNQN